MAKIYKLTCDDPELIYYGSTRLSIWERLSKHSFFYNNGGNSNGYNCSSILLFQKGNVITELMEICDEKDRKEREYFYIKNFPCVNKNLPYTNDDNRLTRKREYHFKNRNEILPKRKQYREENRDKILQQKHESYVKHKTEINKRQKELILCECGTNIRKSDIARHRKSKKHENLIKNIKVI